MLPFRQESGFTRRQLLRLLILGPVLRASAAEPAEPRRQGGTQSRIPAQREITAGRWRTWLVPSVRALHPAPVPSRISLQGRAEFEELHDLQARRSDLIRILVEFWEPQGGIPRWSQILLDTIRVTRTDPVRASRALALIYTAVADAAICAWDAKFTHNRPQPSTLDPRLTSLAQSDYLLPPYPSEHGAIAGAAATVLNELFPRQTALVHGRRMSFDEASSEAGASRLWAGANYRSDVEAGFAIGRAVGRLAVARGRSDGSDAVWDAATQPGRPLGPQYWMPAPPANIFPPLYPLAGTWKPWLMRFGGEFRSPIAPAHQGVFPSARFLVETMEVKQTIDNLAPEQLTIARFWADDLGTSYTPPGHWAQIATEQVVATQVSTPRAARALALIGAGLADSAIACWHDKYAYWVLRPITAIRTLARQQFYDPNFLTPVVTPPFPAYTSGHSTFSGCSAEVLEYLFPEGRTADAFGRMVPFQEAAEQAAVSRLYGGIHYRSDNEHGLRCGRRIADLVIRRARSDGAP